MKSRNFKSAQPQPTPPLNIASDYSGDGLYLALAMLAAILETRSSGKGQVVDTAIQSQR